MHDMGNPPFGHAGENAISEFFKKPDVKGAVQSHVTDKEWSDITNFEGNAQGFRLVNKVNYQGLKLTFATMGAFTKYPRESKIASIEKGRKSQKKYGFLQSNKLIFQEMAENMGLIKLGTEQDAAWCRHPLAFLVEAADDICYNIVDLEDGTNLGLVSLGETRSLLAEIIGERFDPIKFEKISNVKEKVGSLRALAITELISQCVDVFMDKEVDLLEGKFDGALTDHIPSSQVLKRIQSISLTKIYKSRPVIEREIAGFEVLNGLLTTFVPAVLQSQSKEKQSWHNQSLLKLLPIEIQDELGNQKEIYHLLLVLLDFISGMTDSYALSLYRNIKGISLPTD